ncbi:LysR family transcriptional regulator [Labilithrix luteola]|uniref:LysR family transcriptional regulator n=1 Tax=Labilithrix luteola TaxID=1391654 RepID=UPI0011BAA4C8
MATLDINLLVALDALLHEGSVAKAAQRMNLSAPAMSRTLTRIREAIGDPVFVRAGRGLVPTPRALAMRERVRALVQEAEALLGPDAASHPSTFERVFTIRVNDGVVATLGGDLVRRARAEAPSCVLRFVAEGDEDVAALREGLVDIDIGVQGPLGPEVRVQTIAEDAYVAIVGAKSPLARGRMTLERFAHADHVSVSRRGRTRGPIDAQLEKAGLSRRVVATVPNLLAAAALVSQIDAIALVAESVLRKVGTTMGVRRVQAPFPLGKVIVAQAWHPRFDHDPAHAWLRRTVKELAAQKPKR